MRNAALTLSTNFIKPAFNIINVNMIKEQLQMPDMHKIYVQSQQKKSSMAIKTTPIKELKLDSDYVQARRESIKDEIYAKRDALMRAIQYLDKSLLFKKK